MLIFMEMLNVITSQFCRYCSSNIYLWLAKTYFSEDPFAKKEYMLTISLQKYKGISIECK